MRFFKLNAALLALIFSIVAGVLFFLATRAFGHTSEFGTPLNFINWLFFWFLESPGYYLPRALGEVLCVPFCFLQLWLLFLVGIVFARYVSRKNNPRTLKMIITLLIIALVASFLFLIYSQLWENSNLKNEVGYLAKVRGYEEADKDFTAGKHKILIISDECYEDKFSGTNDGPFEVWIAQYYPSLPWPNRYSTEERIKSYNLWIKKWSLTHTNNVISNH